MSGSVTSTGTPVSAAGLVGNAELVLQLDGKYTGKVTGATVDRGSTTSGRGTRGPNRIHSSIWATEEKCSSRVERQR